MVTQFLVKTFALSFQGYYYNQGSDDSGSSALRGDFQGESVGVGLAMSVRPNASADAIRSLPESRYRRKSNMRRWKSYGKAIVVTKRLLVRGMPRG